jgi:hypothetical protein
MARDTERYVYLYVGIPRDSETYQKLLDDVEETGVAAPKLLAVRIADFYRQMTTTIARPASSQTKDLPEEGMDEDVALMNANAVLDEWG